MDRNVLSLLTYRLKYGSLSARRAWIEIPAGCWRDARRAVALRKESVDRNAGFGVEIDGVSYVALRKESVDRNVRLLMCF